MKSIDKEYVNEYIHSEMEHLKNKGIGSDIYNSFKSAKDPMKFIEETFDNIKVLDNSYTNKEVYAKDLGFSWEDFRNGMFGLYKDLREKYNEENIMSNREFYVVRDFKGYYKCIENIIVSNEERAKEIADIDFLQYSFSDYSYNTDDNLLIIEKYRIKDDNINDLDSLYEIFYNKQGDIVDYYDKSEEPNNYFEKIEEVDSYIFNGMERNDIRDEIEERNNGRKNGTIKIYNAGMIEEKIEVLNKDYIKAIEECEVNKEPIGYSPRFSRKFIENLKENGYEKLVDSREFWNFCFYRDIETIDLMPDKFKTDTMCKNAVDYWSCFIKSVPEDILERNQQLIHKAIKDNAYCINYIPEKYINDEFYKKALEINKDIVKYNEKIFKKPVFSKEENMKLYEKMINKSSINNKDLLKLFKETKIYADEKGNAIFPIRNEEDKIVGAYKLNINGKTIPQLVKGSLENQDVRRLAISIYASIQNEQVIDQVEELEIE